MLKVDNLIFSITNMIIQNVGTKVATNVTFIEPNTPKMDISEAAYTTSSFKLQISTFIKRRI